MHPSNIYNDHFRTLIPKFCTTFSTMAMQTTSSGKLDRTTTCPFHLKLFYRTGSFHRYQLPSSHSSLPPFNPTSTNTYQSSSQPKRLPDLPFHPSSPPPPNLHLANLHPPRALPPARLRTPLSPPLPLHRHAPGLPPHLPRHALHHLPRALHQQRTRLRGRRRGRRRRGRVSQR